RPMCRINWLWRPSPLVDTQTGRVLLAATATLRHCAVDDDGQCTVSGGKIVLRHAVEVSALLLRAARLRQARHDLHAWHARDGAAGNQWRVLGKLHGGSRRARAVA